MFDRLSAYLSGKNFLTLYLMFALWFSAHIIISFLLFFLLVFFFFFFFFNCFFCFKFLTQFWKPCSRLNHFLRKHLLQFPTLSWIHLLRSHHPVVMIFLPIYIVCYPLHIKWENRRYYMLNWYIYWGICRCQ